MYLTADTLDDLLYKVFGRLLLRSRSRVSATRGSTAELTGVLLRLSNPRARLSRTEKKGLPFGCLGELLWYLAGSRETAFIRHYLPHYEEDLDTKTMYGAYGPRLLRSSGGNQIANVIRLLKSKPTSRRAVIQIFRPEDIRTQHAEIPCTCSIQLLQRGKRLELMTFMRSNDAFLGLANDVFAFTMMQEMFARMLNVDVGPYWHAVGSLHLYDDRKTAARAFLDEGWQTMRAPMPAMPVGDPTSSIKELLRVERLIRGGRNPGIDSGLDPYWQDLIRLLKVYSCFKGNDHASIARLKKEMHSRLYDPYIDRKTKKAADTAAPRPHQETLPLLSRS
jgi:thymidylate synthase